MKAKKIKKEKKIKIVPLPKFRNKLLKLWSEACREKENFTCVMCGIKRGEVDPLDSERIGKIDCHHALQKYIKDCPLKFDIRNSVVVCAKHHKFSGTDSFHKAPIVAYEWFRIKYPEKHKFILENKDFKVDLDNRAVLEEIEQRLLAKEPLDLEKLKQIERDFPKVIKEKKPKVEEKSIDDQSNIINI
jgi:hypothetical protein